MEVPALEALPGGPASPALLQGAAMHASFRPVSSTMAASSIPLPSAMMWTATNFVYDGWVYLTDSTSTLPILKWI